MGKVTYHRGDITTIKNVDAICHQVNCLTIKAHGLSSNIALAYPWADIYSKRKAIGTKNLATESTRGVPGQNVIYSNGTGFHVVCLQAQWEYGKCYQSLRKRIDPYYDTTDQRVRWFKNCLNALGQLHHLQTLAFPEKIGCGLGGGNWSTYLKLIENFADVFDKHVIIITYDR